MPDLPGEVLRLTRGETGMRHTSMGHSHQPTAISIQPSETTWLIAKGRLLMAEWAQQVTKDGAMGLRAWSYAETRTSGRCNG